jgi:threonine synthase
VKYLSTRGEAPPVGVLEVVQRGLAPDGGLYVPEALPEAPSGPGVSGLLAPFLAPEWGPDECASLVRSSLDFSLPVRRLEGRIHLLELFHGPSGAFKDVGARVLARILGRAARGGGAVAGGRRTVLVATSGDTGGAVAAAFDRVPGTRVFVLFPRGAVTPLQRRQFTTLGDNVVAVAVPGPFDACQELVRAALADEDLRLRHRLTSANSINLGRLLPQMLYYLHAARRLEPDDGDGSGAPDPPTFVVPSGNLGNLTAGIMAGRIAIPGARFLGAVNRNRALVDWLEGREPDPEAPTHATPSTAMDVGRPSNLERLRWLAEATGDDLADRVTAESVDDEATMATLADVYRRHGVVVCPHTAVGLAAARSAAHADPGAGPLVVLATAHPAKFADVVRRATGAAPALPPRLARLAGREERIVELTGGSAGLTRLLDGA